MTELNKQSAAEFLCAYRMLEKQRLQAVSHLPKEAQQEMLEILEVEELQRIEEGC